jgi:pimeloyl-ACP methyl ester carboxylesterase
MWVLNIKELSNYFYCIAVDVLGGPGKSIPNENYNKKTFNQQTWLNEIVDYYKLKNFDILGISNGAVIAFDYTINEPDNISKVICLEGGIVINRMKTMIKTMIKTIGLLFPEIIIPTKNNMINVMRKLSSPNSDIYQKYPEILDFLVLLMKSHNQKAMFIRNIREYNEDISIKYKNKFYFLISDYKTESKKDFINALISGEYKYKVIQNAGYGINFEQPEIINNEIISFLKK